MFDFLTPAISVLKELIPFLSAESKTENITKRLLLRELRDNFKVLMYAHEKNADIRLVIDQLNNSDIKDSIKGGFDFNKVRKGKITLKHVNDERNKKYIGWNCAKLFDKIDEKIEELRTIKKLYTNIEDSKRHVSVMVANLYFRMRLLADFLRQA